MKGETDQGFGGYLTDIPGWHIASSCSNNGRQIVRHSPME